MFERKGLPALIVLALAVTVIFVLSVSRGKAIKSAPSGRQGNAVTQTQVKPPKPDLFRGKSAILADSLNAGHQADLLSAEHQLRMLADSIDFRRAPGKFTLVISKDAAYAYLLENSTEQVLSASPVAIGALHNNVRNYLSSGSGLHTFHEYVEFSWKGGSFGRGVLRFNPSQYVTGSDCFIAIHGTNEERYILNSKQPSDRYLTHGCIRLPDPFIKTLGEHYRREELKQMILIPFSQPSNRVTQNEYTRRFYGKWRNSCGAWQGPEMDDLIAVLRKEWG